VAAEREAPGRSGQTGEGSTLMHRCASEYLSVYVGSTAE
jgi:hypothetical protein